MLGVLFLNHDLTKVQVSNPLILNLSLLFVFASLVFSSLRKTKGDMPLSLLQTNQMKGIAIIVIILHHLSIYVIKNPTDLAIFIDAGYVGVAVFLMISEMGIYISLESKGIKDFFFKKIIRLYIPVGLAMVLEVSLIHILLPTQSNILLDFGRIIFDILKVDRNMWFVVFILFWYCMLYLTFCLNLSKTAKLIFLVSVSVIILSIPNPSTEWSYFTLGKINAFSFPVGCLIGIKHKFIVQKLEVLRKSNIAILFGAVFCLVVLSNLTNYFALKHSKVGFLILLGLVAIVSRIYIVNKKLKLDNRIETYYLVLAVAIVYFNYLNLGSEHNNIAVNTFDNLSGMLSAGVIGLLVTTLVKFNVYSMFLSFLGDISFEVYLLHGMFMYSFDFILFRGNIAVTFFVYFAILCLGSWLFKNLNSLVYRSRLNRHNT